MDAREKIEILKEENRQLREMIFKEEDLSLRLSPQETILFNVLKRKTWVTTDRLGDALEAGGSQSDDYRRLARRVVWKLKQKVANIYRFETAWGQGYRMTRKGKWR